MTPSRSLEVVWSYFPLLDSEDPRSIDLIVTANPVSYADWVAEHDWDGHDNSPLADPHSDAG